MFIPQERPRDFACGYNLDLMIQALPRIDDQDERIAYANRIVGLIKQSHINWVYENGDSPLAWEHFFTIAGIDLRALGIENPYETGAPDLAK